MAKTSTVSKSAKRIAIRKQSEEKKAARKSKKAEQVELKETAQKRMNNKKHKSYLFQKNFVGSDMAELPNHFPYYILNYN